MSVGVHSKMYAQWQQGECCCIAVDHCMGDTVQHTVQDTVQHTVQHTVQQTNKYQHMCQPPKQRSST